MSEHPNAGMIIRYLDGTESHFVFSRDDADGAEAVTRLEEALKAGVLLVTLEDRLLAIPFGSIRNVEIVPPPKNLPRYALRDVRMTGSA